MKKQFGKNIEEIDNKIAGLLAGLETAGVTDDIYEVTLSHIDTLQTIRSGLVDSKQTSGFNGVGADTIVTSAVGIGSLLMILHYEKADVITSKAFNMVTRLIGK